MRITKHFRRFGVLAVSATLLSLAQSAVAWTKWNHSPDPYANYGLCLQRGIGSALGTKANLLSEAGETLANVLAITVLECRPFDGGGGTRKVQCPAGSPYAYCLENDNDGLGNHVELGILKSGPISDPNSLYTGCPSGAQLHTKMRLLRLANEGPRLVKGIVTLGCSAATEPALKLPTRVNCPKGNNPYAYCLGTPNDGFGNAVKVGVVSVTDAGDPYGLYGECNTTLVAYGIKPGFLSKSSIVQAAGRSLDNVRLIDVVVCNAPAAMGTIPTHLEVKSCSDLGPYFTRYDYCIGGTDEKGNGLNVGVNWK